MIVIMSTLHDLLAIHGSVPRDVAQGQTLFRAGDKVAAMFAVITGEVALERVSEQGARLVLQRACAGDLVAEPSVFANYYHCDAVALSNAVVKSVPISAVLRVLRQDACVMEQFARHLAREVHLARQRVEMLSLARLSDRLDAWLLMNGTALPPKGQWLALAAQLAVSPEALYRELAKRRKT